MLQPHNFPEAAHLGDRTSFCKFPRNILTPQGHFTKIGFSSNKICPNNSRLVIVANGIHDTFQIVGWWLMEGCYCLIAIGGYWLIATDYSYCYYWLILSSMMVEHWTLLQLLDLVVIHYYWVARWLNIEHQPAMAGQLRTSARWPSHASTAMIDHNWPSMHLGIAHHCDERQSNHHYYWLSSHYYLVVKAPNPSRIPYESPIIMH